MRSEALWSLSRAGGLAAAQIDAVVVVLRDPDPATRRRAVAAIGEMGDTKQAVTAAAKTRVADADARGRRGARRWRTPMPTFARKRRRRSRKLGGEAPATAAVAADPAASARGTTTPAEASAVALLRERKITMESGSYFQALAGTDVRVVRAFLDAGMSASAPVAGSGPPLVVMLQVGDACAPGVRPTKADTKAMIKLLLERGADANRGDGNGFTPLMAASMKGCDREVMKLLIGAGAKVGATNAMGHLGLRHGSCTSGTTASRN